MQKSLTKILTKNKVEASAPCRIDSGGTWDIKALALPLENFKPTTVNAALTLRTSVTLTPFDDGWIRISSEGFPKGQHFPAGRLSFEPPFGLFFAAVSYFGFHGVAVLIRSQSPVKSALGGSSTALVALLKALNRASILEGGKRLAPGEILHLAYHLEDAVSGGNCGLQDQAAAVYGGVNQWTWHFGRPGAHYRRIPLLSRQGQKTFSKRLLVAYSGKAHVSLNTNRKWIRDFLSGKTRGGWIQANRIVHDLARAIKEMNWTRAAVLLRKEMALRKKITPEALIPITAKLVDQAEALGCGARFAGAGAGGSLWAVGREKDIDKLSHVWQTSLAGVKGGRVLDCAVDAVGVR